MGGFLLLKISPSLYNHIRPGGRLFQVEGTNLCCGDGMFGLEIIVLALKIFALFLLSVRINTLTGCFSDEVYQVVEKVL